MAASARYTREAQPVDLIRTSGGNIARATCAVCGGHDEWTLRGKTPPPEALPKHFSNSGWNMKKSICPLCNQKEKPAMATVSPIKPAESETTDQAKKIKRMVYMFLEDCYDDNKKAYKDKHSDASLAKEIGASEAFIAKIREQDFGPLKAPSEFQEIRKDVTLLASEIGKMQTRLNEIARLRNWG